MGSFAFSGIITPSRARTSSSTRSSNWNQCDIILRQTEKLPPAYLLGNAGKEHIVNSFGFLSILGSYLPVTAKWVEFSP